MIPAKNTVSMAVLLADSFVYLCISLKLNPDLHLNKSSIFPRMGKFGCCAGLQTELEW